LTQLLNSRMLRRMSEAAWGRAGAGPCINTFRLKQVAPPTLARLQFRAK
jgi:hypothetical protein